MENPEEPPVKASARPETEVVRAGPVTLGCCGLIIGLPLVVIMVGLLTYFLPLEVSLEQAHYDTEKFVGREVRLKGWLRRFEGSTGIHYGVEDSQKNRVGIREFDTQKLEKLLDQPVLVEGKFNFDEQFGIYVTARLVKPYP